MFERFYNSIESKRLKSRFLYPRCNTNGSTWRLLNIFHVPFLNHLIENWNQTFLSPRRYLQPAWQVGCLPLMQIWKSKWKSYPGFTFSKSWPQLDQVYCAWLIKWWIISGTWWYWVSIWRYLLVLGQLKLVSSIKQKLSHAMTYDGNFSNQSLVLSPCQSGGLGDPRSYNVPRSFLEIQHTVATASQGHWQPMR